jgi:hypothetical protein
MALAQQLCRRLGYLLWTAPDADNNIALILDAPISSGAAHYQLQRVPNDGSTWEWIGNILSGGYELNGRVIPTEVHIMGNAARGDGTSARYLSNITNELGFEYVDKLYARPTHPVYRVSTRSRTNTQAEHEAARIISDANSKFEVHDYTVQGHGQELDEQWTIYAVNSIAHVRDDLTGINKDLIITRVEFTGSREHGQTTKLRMVPLGSITVSPEGE